MERLASAVFVGPSARPLPRIIIYFFYDQHAKKSYYHLLLLDNMLDLYQELMYLFSVISIHRRAVIRSKYYQIFTNPTTI